jgi:hypothetical protein
MRDLAPNIAHVSFLGTERWHAKVAYIRQIVNPLPALRRLDYPPERNRDLVEACERKEAEEPLCPSWQITGPRLRYASALGQARPRLSIELQDREIAPAQSVDQSSKNDESKPSPDWLIYSRPKFLIFLSRPLGLPRDHDPVGRSLG